MAAEKTSAQSKASSSGFSRLFGNATTKKQPANAVDKDVSRSETTTRSPEVAKSGSRSPGVGRTGSRSPGKKASNKVVDATSSKSASDARTKAADTKRTQEKYVLLTYVRFC